MTLDGPSCTMTAACRPTTPTAGHDRRRLFGSHDFHGPRAGHSPTREATRRFDGRVSVPRDSAPVAAPPPPTLLRSRQPRQRPLRQSAASSPIPPLGGALPARRRARINRPKRARKPTRRKDMTEPRLYERLGGAFAIAAVIDHFSDAVVRNQITGQGSQDPELDEWSRDQLARLPGLKFMRTLWVCELAGGPQVYGATKPGKTHFGLEEAHRA